MNLEYSRNRRDDRALEATARRLKDIVNRYWSALRTKHGSIVSHAIGKMAKDRLEQRFQYQDWKEGHRGSSNFKFVEDCTHPLTAGGQFVREFCQETGKKYPPDRVILGSVFSGGLQEDRVMDVDGSSTIRISAPPKKVIPNKGGKKSARAPSGGEADDEGDTLDLHADPGELFQDRESSGEDDDLERRAELEALEDEDLAARGKRFVSATGEVRRHGKPWKSRSSPVKNRLGRRARRPTHHRDTEKNSMLFD